MSDLGALLKLLATSGIDFILVGGAAATAHGSVRLTQDIDVVYDRRPENLRRLVTALAPHHPYLRGAPPGLPFVWDERTLKQGLNFTLATDLGPIDLLGEITGGGAFADLRAEAMEMTIFGSACLVLGLQKLISVKRATGRLKDLEAVAELEAIAEERSRGGT